MPTEFRFDDLDLREESARGDAALGSAYTDASLGCASDVTFCTQTCCSANTLQTRCC
jgi:hypothetical protein